MSERSDDVELSVVSPVYLGAGIVEELVTQIRTVLAAAAVGSYEIILVEDGSPDSSWEEIQEVCAQHAEVIGIKLTRNFGQHPAISAGLKHSRGKFVAVMDCDLQDDPKYLVDILQSLRAGMPIVLGRKLRREHSFFKNCTARIFNMVLNRLTDNRNVFGDGRVGAFSGLSRRVVDEFNQMKDVHRHYLMIIRWLGFPIHYIDMTHRPRLIGTSGYTISKLMIHAINGITSQSTRLLRLFVVCGFSICALALLALVVVLGLYFFQGFKEGWASLICIMLFSMGVLLFALGVVGTYIGQILEQVRQRPLYVVDRIVGPDE